MKKIHTYEQYSEILSAFKKDKAGCSTNKLFTQGDLSVLIDAGKLYYDEIDGTLWFFVNRDYFYSANFFVPANATIQMRKQDMDVLVDLTGNQSRYNEQWERELVAAGYEKGDKRLEWACQLDDKNVIDYLQTQHKERIALWGAQGFTLRKATKADYPEMYKLWEVRFGKHRYAVHTLTDAEQEEMEKYGRCIVICDPEGNICAASIYIKNHKTAYGFLTATNYPGLGSWAFCERCLSAYQEGCTRHVSWVRVDNRGSIRMNKQVQTPTGKYYWQFICKA